MEVGTWAKSILTLLCLRVKESSKCQTKSPTKETGRKVCLTERESLPFMMAPFTRVNIAKAKSMDMECTLFPQKKSMMESG